jgi:hypothetical protein
MAKLTARQLSIFADALEKRFRENRDLFKLNDPPRHAMTVALTPAVSISFSGNIAFTESVDIVASHELYEIDRPFILLHPIQFFVYFIARKKLWNIAEDMLGNTPDKADRLLYNLFPEMLEKNIKDSSAN